MLATLTLPSVTLDHAADLIEEWGWIQGVDLEKDGRMCMIGALDVSCGKVKHHWRGANLGYRVEYLRLGIDDPEYRVYIEAEKFLERVIARVQNNRANSIVSYNDATSRTKVQVVKALRKAAVLARSKGR